MKRPNLVNPQNWTPFRSIPINTPIPVPVPVPINTPIPVPVPVPVPMYLSKKEVLQRNSFYLNLFCLLIILGITYFLYSIYLERKIFSDYLEYVKNVQEEHYPGFL